jgi:hypothetical protein
MATKTSIKVNPLDDDAVGQRVDLHTGLGGHTVCSSCLWFYRCGGKLGWLMLLALMSLEC